MQFFAIVPVLSALAGLALASPVPDAVPDVLAGQAKDTVFKYCTGDDFKGNCNRDDDSNLNHCGE